MRCPLSQRLEPEILHFTYSSGGGGWASCQASSQQRPLPWGNGNEWPPRTHLKPGWFGSKPGPVWPRPHRRGQNGKST